MAVALTLQLYLESHGIRYDVLVHQQTMTARQTARTCGISADWPAPNGVVRGECWCMTGLGATARVAGEVGHRTTWGAGGL